MVQVSSGRPPFVSDCKKLRHQTFGGLRIAAALNQHVENEAILIDSSPQPIFLAANGNDDLIEMPFVAEPTGGSPAYFACKVTTKFLRLKAHGLVKDDDPTRCQQIFNHPETEGETESEPHREGNHFSWEPGGGDKGDHERFGSCRKIAKFNRQLVNFTVPTEFAGSCARYHYAHFVHPTCADPVGPAVFKV